MSQPAVLEPATLRDFLRGAASRAVFSRGGGVPLQGREPPARALQVEGLILLDFIPSLDQLGEVIRENRGAY